MASAVAGKDSVAGKDIVIGLWGDVINTVNRILDADRKFGFGKIEASLNPSLTEILHGLGIIEFALTYFLDSELLDHDEIRQALNSKQCVLHIRWLTVALRDDNEDDYKQAISLLNSQAKF